MMNERSRQFDPDAQFDAVMAEIESITLDLSARIERLQWLRQKIAEQMAAMRERADNLELFTDAEAAAIFKYENVESFESLRRRMNFPHVKIGNQVRYTPRHLQAIADMLTIGGGPKSKAQSPKELRRAA